VNSCVSSAALSRQLSVFKLEADSSGTGVSLPLGPALQRPVREGNLHVLRHVNHFLPTRHALFSVQKLSKRGTDFAANLALRASRPVMTP
jgi:hypothetical protein